MRSSRAARHAVPERARAGAPPVQTPTARARGRVQGHLDGRPLHPQLRQLPFERVAELRRSPGSAARDDPRALAERRRQPIYLVGELGQTIVRRAEDRHPISRTFQERQHVLVGRPVFALQRLQRRDPFPDLLQPNGVRDERLPVRADVARQLVQLDRKPTGPRRHLAGARVVACRIVERRGHRQRLVDQRGLARQRVLGRSRLSEEPLDVRETPLLGGEIVGLCSTGSDRLDLPDLVGEEVELPFALAHVRRELVERRPRGPPAIPRVTVGGERDQVDVARESVQEGGLHGGWTAVAAPGAARAPPPTTLPSSPRLEAVAICPPIRDRRSFPSTPTVRARTSSRPRPTRRPRPPGTSNRRLGSSKQRRPAPPSHQRGGAARTQRQRQTNGHHRLAGAGLPGEDVQPGAARGRGRR